MRPLEIRVPALVSGSVQTLVDLPDRVLRKKFKVGSLLVNVKDFLVLKQTKVGYFFKLLLQRNC